MKGSIQQRGKNSFRIIIPRGRDPVTGKYKRDYFTFHGTKKEAEAYRLELLHQLNIGTYTGPCKATVGEFLTQWLEDSVKGSVAPKTYKQYEVILKVHLLPAIGGIQLNKLSPQHLVHLYRQKQEAGSPYTARQCHALLHKALGQAVKWGIISRNPADVVDRPKVPRKEMRTFTPEEAARFLEAARNDRLYPLYVLAVTCGLRQGELLGLKWEDVDLKAGILQVKRQLQWIKGGFIFREPKSTKSRRTITLPTLALSTLKKHRKIQAQERLALGEAWQDYGLVFCTEIGTPLNPSNIFNRSFKPLLEKAKLPRIRFHDLRHTAATLLLAQGVHPKLAQEYLGHSQISLTMDTYSHVVPSLQKEVAKAMDKILTAHMKS